MITVKENHYQNNEVSSSAVLNVVSNLHKSGTIALAIKAVS